MKIATVPLFHRDLVHKLLSKSYFIDFVEDQFNEIAETYQSEVDIDKVRSCSLAHDRYLSLHDMFKKAIAVGEPSEYKIAACICFALRRTQPIIDVKPEGSRAILKDDVSPMLALYGIALSEKFHLFNNFANEICSFSLGLRLAHYYAAQSVLKDVSALNADQDQKILFDQMQKIKPVFSENFRLDNLLTLRDHAVSPFSLYVLYQAVFDLTSPK